MWFIIEKKTLTTLHIPPSKHGHSQTRSHIFVTGQMTGSGATTCK